MNINSVTKICILLAILLVGTCQSLIQAREGHSSVLVNNRIYFFGGMIIDASIDHTTDQILYLDVSRSFNGENPYEEIPNVLNPFTNEFATGLQDPQKQSIIYLFGGAISTTDGTLNPTSIIHSYDLTNNKWDIPKTIGAEPERRTSINGVIDNNGKVYIFGGSIGTEAFNDMNIFDTSFLTWSKGSNAPFYLEDYTATLLSNGRIVFIGGRYRGNNSVTEYSTMKQLPVYDTISDSWSLTEAYGAILDNRYGHSAVLTSDGRIIIFGGSIAVSLGMSREPNGPLAVLYTSKDPYEWFPPTSNNPPTLEFHSATLVGYYMLVNFGNPISVNEIAKPSFYILDIRNYTWVTQFEPEIPPTVTSGKNIGVFVGVACACVGVSIISGFLVFKMHKLHKKRKYQHDIPHQLNS